MQKGAPVRGMRAPAGPACIMLILIGFFTTPARAEVDEPVTRSSDITETTAAQWARRGFRLQLRFGWQWWDGLQGVPGGDGFDINFEPAWHFASAWSFGLDMDYTILAGAMSGLRLSVGLGPNWHPTDGLQVGLAMGYAAMLASWTYDTPSNAANLPETGNCYAQGVLGKLRLAYMFQMSDNWATGPAVAGSLSRLHCRAISSTSITADPYGAPYLTPWWQYDINAMWAVTWR